MTRTGKTPEGIDSVNDHTRDGGIYRVEDAWAEILAAESHYDAAAAAVKCPLRDSAGRLCFGDFMVAHSMLALVDELRKPAGPAS